MDIRLPLHRSHDTARRSGAMAFFENKPNGILVRLPKSMISEDTVYLPFRTTVYDNPQVVEFVHFMLKVILRAPDGRVSPKTIWNERLGRPHDSTIDRSEEIDGIRFEHVQQLFIDTFNPGDRVRGRLNGDVQRVWQGYRLASPGDVPTPQTVPAVAPAAETHRTTLEVPYDATTKAKFRYRLDDTHLSLTLYLDKGSAQHCRRPKAYRITAEPIYE